MKSDPYNPENKKISFDASAGKLWNNGVME